MAGLRKKRNPKNRNERRVAWYIDYRGKQVSYTGTTSGEETLKHAKRLEAQHLEIRQGLRPAFSSTEAARGRPFGEIVSEYEVLGPPDIESRVGLTGGNIFQGEVTPDQMWEGRLGARTPVDGLYLSGAATHPAGSVIALNGRNAAMAAISDDAELRASAS